MKRKIYRFLFTIFSLFIFYSCSIGISDKESDERNLTDSVRLKVYCNYDKKGARTLFPTCITDSDISKAVLRAYLIDPSGNVVSSTSLNKSWIGSNVLNQIRDANDIYISTGTFKFILDLYIEKDSEEILCQSGSIDSQVITSEGPNNLNFSTKYVESGKGDVKVTLSWNMAGVYVVKAGLYTAESNGTTEVSAFPLEPLTINLGGTSDYSVVYSKTGIPQGFYFINFELYDNFGTRINFKDSVIRVVTGCPTQGNLSLSKINKTYAVTYILGDGASFISSFTPVEYRNSNTSVYLPTSDKLINDGQYFCGWYDNPDFSGTPMTSVDSGTEDDVIVYARWFKPELYVSSSGLVTNDGKTLSNALPSIEEAMTRLNQGAVASEHLSEDLIIYVSGSVPSNTSITTVKGASLTIKGESSASDILTGDTDGDGIGDGEVLSFYGSMTVNLENLTVTKGKGSGTGGTGGIFVGSGAVLKIQDCIVTENYSPTNGGGIYCSSGKLYLCGSTIVSKNKAESTGGGVNLINVSELYMYDSACIGDSSATSAAAVDSDTNYAESYGGGLYANNSKIYFGYSGLDSSDLPLEASLTGGICYNYSNAQGGGIYLNGASELYMNSGKISFNGSQFSGGGIRQGGSDTVTINDGIIEGNVAGATTNTTHDVIGGGVYVGNSSTLIIKGGTIKNNLTEDDKGGAIYSNCGSVEMSGNFSIPFGTENDVYLAKVTSGSITTQANIKITGSISGSAVATITVQDEAKNDLVLTGTSSLVSSNYSKFVLNSSDFKIRSNGTLGVANLISDIYVSASGEDPDTWSGLSPSTHTASNPFKTLKKALQLITYQEEAGTDYTIHFIGTITGTNEIPASDTTDPSNVITLDSSTLASLSINGADSTNAILDGNSSNAPVLYVSVQIPVTITNLKITGGNDSGLSIQSGATVKLGDGVQITGNTANQGGGVNINEGTLFMYGTALIGESGSTVATSTSYGNTCNNNGAGIYNNSGKVYLGYSGFDSDNNLVEESLTGGVCRNFLSGSSKNGAGIYNYGSGIVLMNSGNVSYNSADSGAGIYSDSQVTINGGTLEGNEASETGGAVYNSNNGKLNINGGTFTSNTANVSSSDQGGGGAVYNASNGQVTITSGTFTGNKSNGTSGSRGGGAIYNGNNGKLSISNADFSQNEAVKYGGAIYNAGGSEVTVEIINGTITNNFVGSGFTYGGGIYNDSICKLSITGTEISNNTADSLGGGIFNWGTLTINSGTDIKQNSVTGSDGQGGGIYNSESSILYLAGGNISKNNSSSNGGGIYNEGELYIYGDTVIGSSSSENSAVLNGGAIYSKAINSKVYLGYKNSSEIEEWTGSISSNTAVNGGAIYMEDGELKINSGTIGGSSSNSKNTATSAGGAIYSSGTVYIGNDALITSGSSKNNDVYLAGENNSVEILSALSNSAVATITPSAYEIGRTVLTGTSIGTYYSYFAVSPQSVNGSTVNWAIDSTGLLIKDSDGGISIVDDDITLGISATSVSSTSNNTLSFTVTLDGSISLTSSTDVTDWTIKLFSGATEITNNTTYFTVDDTNHNITVESGIPSGTTFDVYLSITYNGRTYGGTFTITVS